MILVYDKIRIFLMEDSMYGSLYIRKLKNSDNEQKVSVISKKKYQRMANMPL